jgi:hypothetical protein
VSECFFGGGGKFSAIFLIAFWNSPCYECPKTRLKKSSKTTEGEKKTEGKKATFFVMSPGVFFRVFERPLLRNTQKRDNTKR